MIESSAITSPSRGRARALLALARPRQWVKNLLVIAAPGAAGALGSDDVPARVLTACVAFCLISAGIYALNDVRDRNEDRAHPRKRLRPVAAGELSPRSALRIAALLAIAGVALGTAIAPGLGALACVYLALTASYSLWLRRVAVLDIVVVAAGFVIRALAGGVATDIYVSRWFVIVTACGAMFLVAAKRYAELRAGSGAPAARATLRQYSQRSLLLTLAASASGALLAYTAWAFTRPQHTAWYGLSIVPLVLWLGRYSMLIDRGGGQAPEELVLRDRALLALGAGWGLLFLGGVYVGA